MDVGSNLNPGVIFQSLAKNPIDYVTEEGRRETTTAEWIAKGIESLQLALTFILVGEQHALKSPNSFWCIPSAALICYRESPSKQNQRSTKQKLSGSSSAAPVCDVGCASDPCIHVQALNHSD